MRPSRVPTPGRKRKLPAQPQGPHAAGCPRHTLDYSSHTLGPAVRTHLDQRMLQRALDRHRGAAVPGNLLIQDGLPRAAVAAGDARAWRGRWGGCGRAGQCGRVACSVSWPRAVSRGGISSICLSNTACRQGQVPSRRTMEGGAFLAVTRNSSGGSSNTSLLLPEAPFLPPSCPPDSSTSGCSTSIPLSMSSRQWNWPSYTSSCTNSIERW